jgi:methylase of polypeptide subunit release factors
MAVFKPNLTSRLIRDSAISYLQNRGGAVLEIGCGSGWITSEIIRSLGVGNRKFFLSDVSSAAVETARKQLIPYVPHESIKIGPGLAPWAGNRFSLVINDVSGISDSISEVSDWYEGVPFAAGLDGLENSREILAALHAFLDFDGAYIVPVISLSDVKSHLAMLNKCFRSVALTAKKIWPLPKVFEEHEQMLIGLRHSKAIDIEFKYGKWMAYTQVAVCLDLTGGVE